MSTIENIISNSVLACQSYLVDDLLAKGYFTVDDIENSYSNICYYCETELKDDEYCPKCEKHTENTPQDIMEWWLVDSWLADKLREAGAPILNHDYGTWYGRTETGQSLTMDYYLNKVAEKLDKE